LTQDKNRKMNVAIVGCGAMAREHLRALRGLDTVRLVAICDTSEEAVTRMSGEWGIGKSYTNYSEMLDKEQLSIVSVLTPPTSHAPLVIGAVERGISVLTEKPLTMTTNDAHLILKSLATSKAKLTVNYNWLLSRTMTSALSLVTNGTVGDVLGMDVTVLDTRYDAMTADEKHWSHKLPGGRFGEMLCHPIYLVQSVLGNELKPITVLWDKRGSYSWMHSDELYLLLQANVGVARVYVSFNAPRPAILIDIYGERRILKVDLINQSLIQLGPRKLTKMDSAIDSLSVSGGLLVNVLRNTFRHLLRERGSYALEAAYTSLIASMNGNEQRIATPEMAYNTVKTVEEICNRM
jgi:predicted dehydrogenase